MWTFVQPVKAQFFNEQGLKFIKLLNWLEDQYVDSVNVDELTEKAIVELLQKLDPHSTYYSKKEVEAINEPLNGSFDGIGITFSVYRDSILVVKPIKDGPSEKAGIKAGDRLVKINGETVVGRGMKTDDVFDRLRGKKGSLVHVEIKRKGIDSLLTFNVSRDRIPIHSVEASYKVENDIGYIRLSRFSSNTINEFRSALQTLKKQKVNSLILDLTGNGGGYLDVAISLSDEFLEKDKLIVYTNGLHSPKKEFESTKKGNFERGHLVLLIDEGSASASEIVAGAIQDWDRGILVGRRSYGKGLVQRQMFFPDSSMIRLTTARYYTPTGRLIQKSYSNGYKEYNRDIIRRINNGELTNAQKNMHVDSVKFYTLLHKRIVYGGGGITPDVFVPVDTSASDYVKRYVSKGILNKFIVKYIDDNRLGLQKKYSSFDAFKAGFPENESFFKDLVEFNEKENKLQLPEEAYKSKEYLVSVTKAYIARDLFGTSEFYEILNQTEREFAQAIEILRNWDDYNKKLAFYQ